MKRSIRLLSLFCLLVLLVTASACGYGNHESHTSRNPNESTTTTAPPKDDDPNGGEIVIPGDFTDRIIKGEADAILAVQDAKESLGLQSATDELTVSSVHTVDDLTFYRLHQNYNGIPVFGAEFVLVSSEDGQVSGLVSSAADLAAAVDVTPTVDYNTAVSTVATHFNNPISLPSLTDEQLTIFVDEADNPTLAYSTEVLVNGEPYRVILDADNGSVLMSHTLTYTLTTPTVETMLAQNLDVLDAQGYELQRIAHRINGAYYYRDEHNLRLYDWTGKLTYTMKKAENGIYDVYDLSGNCISDQITDSSTFPCLYTLSPAEEKDKVECRMQSDLQLSEPDGVNRNREATVLVENIALSQTFFKTLFARNGYDNNGGKVIAIVNNYPAKIAGYSAPWISGACLLAFEKNVNLTADLVGHEYMHSVERSISGMVYQGESGAIMEAYSDIFGELIEDFEGDGLLNGGCNWENECGRSPADPTKNNNPKRYGGRYWRSTLRIDEANDYGGVHNNSTVISHAAYLMTRDSTAGTALNHNELAKLWYKTLFTLPQSATFNTLHRNMIMVAKALGFSQDKITRIDAAFQAVGIGVDSNVSDATYSGGLELEAKEDGSYKIIGLGTCTDRNLMIPAITPEGYVINEIADFAFYECEMPVSVEIPTSIKRVGVSAFRYCNNLESVVISAGVSEIDEYAFADCRKLGYLKLGEGIETISNFTFAECTNLSHVLIPDSVSLIGESAFFECKALLNVSFGPGSRLETIKEHAFNGCESLAGITIPNATTTIETSAFRYCSTLEKVVLGNGLKTVGPYAFADCPALRSLKMGQSLEVIEINAFALCESLTELHFPDSLKTISEGTFFECISLHTVTFGTNSKLETIAAHAFNGCKNLGTLRLPNQLKSIGVSAFRDCEALELVVFGTGLESISGWAFDGCNAISAVYYRGSEAAWKGIHIDGYNQAITDCTIGFI